ncbi:MAG: hypothetical protein IPL52_03565 [Flavobacteriales bacterium]|nr:hypothetical protein [Flavobacteriales bacterium]
MRTLTTDLHSTTNRLCALLCAWLVFMLPVMSAANTRVVLAEELHTQQQPVQEEEHKTCAHEWPALALNIGVPNHQLLPVPYAEAALIAHHGEVAVPPPERA